jgi:hypothetical protein
MILEKAWAKLNGNYMRIEKTSVDTSASHLLGLPTYTVHHNYKTNTQDQIW